MKTFTLPLLAAVALSAVTIGSAGAMPFSTNNGSLAQSENLVQDVRMVCNRNGNCWNTNSGYRRGYSQRYYDRRSYHRGYGYDRGYHRGPRVGVGVGPFGFGVY